MPPARRAVTEADRAEAADWRIAGFALTETGYMDRVRRGGVARRRAARQQVMSEIHLFHADSIPRVRGLFAAGDCLFLSGFHPPDWQDGTSLTWVVINVRKRALEGVLRPRPPPDGSLRDFPEYSQSGAAVRDFDTRFAFTMRRMADGAAAVERFPLPEGWCGP